MPKYKPVLASFDQVSYDAEMKLANQKIDIFKEALEFAEHSIVVFDTEAFGHSFTTFFKDEFYKMHLKDNTLGLTVDKLLFVKDIDLSPLQRLETKFKEIDVLLSYESNSCPTPNIDSKPFEKWTKSAEENERLRDGKRLIECIEFISKHTKMYPFDISRGTSGFLGYDIRLNKWYVNYQKR